MGHVAGPAAAEAAVRLTLCSLSRVQLLKAEAGHHQAISYFTN